MRHNYIGGEWVAGVSSRPNLNPSDLSDIIDHYAQGDEQQTLDAIAIANARRNPTLMTPCAGCDAGQRLA